MAFFGSHVRVMLLSLLTRRAQMLSRGSGHITVLSSVAGKLGGVPCSSSYAATKHALQGYFDTLRVELSARGIGVTMACPGPVVSNIALNAFTSRVCIGCGAVTAILVLALTIARQVDVVNDKQPHEHNQTKMVRSGARARISVRSRFCRVKCCCARPCSRPSAALSSLLELPRTMWTRCGAVVLRCDCRLTCAQAWIAEQPILFFMYVNQYIPTLYKWLGSLCSGRGCGVWCGQ